jgi:hypothetical protein
MAKQVLFLKKNILDLSITSVTMTVTDAVATNNGQDIIDFTRNRNNSSAWLTTGSTDAANTEILAEFGVGRDVSDIILVLHNWKAFTIQYWDSGALAWADFSTPINETANTERTSHFEFDRVETDKIKIVITGTLVVDDDKELYQLIASDRVQNGYLNGWPVIKNPTHDRLKKVTNMLSGKISLLESFGGFSADLEVSQWRDADDLALVEDIYFRREGVLMWLSGGDDDQFQYAAIGYRKEDIYFVRPVNHYEPEMVKGIYSAGLKLTIKFKESID